MHNRRTGIHESGKLKQARLDAVVLTCCATELCLLLPHMFIIKQNIASTKKKVKGLG